MSVRPIADPFEEIPFKVRQDFARAIAFPGSQAIILGEDNESDGPPVSIAEAVASRRAFTVQLALHNLAIDQDDVEQANALEVFEAEEEERASSDHGADAITTGFIVLGMTRCSRP